MLGAKSSFHSQRGLVLIQEQCQDNAVGVLQDSLKRVPGLTGFPEDCTVPGGREERGGSPASRCKRGSPRMHLSTCSLSGLSLAPIRQDVRSPELG